MPVVVMRVVGIRSLSVSHVEVPLTLLRIAHISEDHSSVCLSTEEDPHDPIVCTTTDDNELEEGCTIPMYAKTTTYKVPHAQRTIVI